MTKDPIWDRKLYNELKKTGSLKNAKEQIKRKKTKQKKIFLCNKYFLFVINDKKTRTALQRKNITKFIIVHSQKTGLYIVEWKIYILTYYRKCTY